LNQLSAQTAGGKLEFSGTVNEPATVTVGGNPATVDGAGNWIGWATVSSGTNSVAVVATDANNNSRTSTYHVMVSGAG
jgi:uncharacterized protein YfaP (DUF2135 family)